MKTIKLISIFGIIGVLLIIGAMALANNNNILSQNQGTAYNNAPSTTGSAAITANTGEVQNVKLSMQGYTYILSQSELKKDVPVRMEVDLSTTTGCMRSINIPAFGVRKTVNEGNNIITFTPTKAGTFNIACSMNMGKGTFSVVDSTGQKSNYVESAPAATGGTCGGASGGGCGCGARQ